MVDYDKRWKRLLKWALVYCHVSVLGWRIVLFRRLFRIILATPSSEKSHGIFRVGVQHMYVGMWCMGMRELY